MKKVEAGIYIHIPFCIRKCLYCDFNSYASNDALKTAYVDALCREVAMVAGGASGTSKRFEASTLYIGGGTPSLLSEQEIEKILLACATYVGWNPDVETTVEANPETIDYDRALELRSLGVNRISLGVQSLDDGMLQQLGRVHSAERALQSFEACRDAGFENISVDLMYALPDQSVDHWTKTLRRVIALAPEHLSLYSLTIEEGTGFHCLWSEGRLQVPGEDEAAEMYEASEYLLAEAGYEHYEISNWAAAQGSFRCRHNLTYWLNQPYLGFGAGAHSYINGTRFNNVLSPEGYVSLVSSGTVPVDQVEEIDVNLEMKETAFLGLRLVDGISRREFLGRFACTLDEVFGTVIDRLVADGLLVNRGDRVALTSKGRLLGNEVFVAFLSE